MLTRLVTAMIIVRRDLSTIVDYHLGAVIGEAGRN